jgi:formylglycine-generating enzyme required for sulfatase activity
LNLATRIRDASGEREVDAGAFPLAVGGGGAAIAIPGSAHGPALAWVGMSEGHAFVQPAPGGPPLVHNGTRITRSTWLCDGDCFEVAGAALRVSLERGRLGLAVETATRHDDDLAIRPPAAPPPGSVSAATAPAPVRATRPQRRSRATRAVLWATFGVLVLTAVYVFTATPVAVQLTPEPTRFELRGPFPAVAVGGRRLVIPGTYSLEADLAGHHPLRETIEVPRAQRLDLAFALRRLPGRVFFELEPADGVEVTVDGQRAGVTPLAPLVLEAGVHGFELERPRYRPLSMEVEVEGLGRVQRVPVALEPLWAPVRIDSLPAGASIHLGDELLGVTPLTVDLLEGSRTLEARLDRHDPQRVEVDVVAQVPLALPTLVLRESDGVVELSSRPADATVIVDGRFAGRTPATLRLRPGADHRIRLSRSGFADAERTVTVAPAEARSLEVPLERLFGTIFVEATPADAELLVNGKSRGSANRRLRLAAVPHELEVRRDGYEPYRTTVTPRPGTSLKVQARLRTVVEAREARTPAVLKTGDGQSLRLIRPRGEFMMGASRREQGARANEYRRRVELSRPYYLATTEVTNAAFRAFKPGHRAGLAGSHSLDGELQPVVGVTWSEAVEYLNWLSAKDGLAPAYVRHADSWALAVPLTTGYRLPTEAEWAYAARFAGPAPRRFAWDGSFPPVATSANYADSSASGLLPNTLAQYADGHPVTAPVGSFAADSLGLFDIGGNVAEWCHDYYAVYPDAASRLERDPSGPAAGKHRVVRGSSWRHWSISELRLSYRDYSAEGRHDLGFRIARSVE